MELRQECEMKNAKSAPFFDSFHYSKCIHSMHYCSSVTYIFESLYMADLCKEAEHLLYVVDVI